VQNYDQQEGNYYMPCSYGKSTPRTTPFTSPSSCYASPSSILNHIPLQSFNHSVHINVGNDIHTTIFDSNTGFGLSDICKMGLEGNTTVGRNGEVFIIGYLLYIWGI
jgi:hypothetical protein